MTDREWIIRIQECIRSGDLQCMDALKQAEATSSGLEQYRFSAACRMLLYWFRYRSGSITKTDFYSSLRSFLLVWNTDLVLPDLHIETNHYGLIQNHSTGNVIVNYDTPQYLTDRFLKAAYMQEASAETSASSVQYDLSTNPFVASLTGFTQYKSMAQKLAVTGALKTPDGYTTLIAMLTGGGKSLVTQTVSYQKRDGLTLVIVPTISLMLDQERNAKSIIHSDTANEIFSYYSQKDMTAFLSALDDQRARILFVSPEALIRNHILREAILKANRTQYIKNLIIDEAHIVTEWGSSFRVDYQCLDSFQRLLLSDNPSLRTFLMSATYSKETVRQLRHFYSNADRWIEIRCDRLRHEPRFCIIKAHGYRDRLEKLEELVGVLPRPMILYVNAPDTAERVQGHLRNFGISNTRVFTGLTSNSEREELIRQWANQDFDLMIATCAFGVGVDKKDVRTVLHLYVPENPDKYYQEAGRGGRDGLPCLSVILYTEEDIDKAFKRMQKVLKTDKLSGRWFSMLQSPKTTRKAGNILIDTSVKPSYNETDGFWTEVHDTDISWNVYVLLLLRRKSLIDILDVTYENNRYLFKIRLRDYTINAPSDEANALFDTVRKDEWDKIYREYEQMRSSLRKSDRICWSEMFNEVYHLTEEYCAGCNAHSNIINEETVRFPLLQSIPALPHPCDQRISDLMGYAQQMLIIADSEEQKALIPLIVKSGIDGIVSEQGNDEIDRIVLSVKADSNCLLMHQHGFYDLSSKGQFYLTGSLLIVLPDDEYETLKMYETAQKLCRCCQTKIIYIACKDHFLSKRGKRLSAITDGPCKQAYLLMKGE
ncbi:MAG TPA: DEAD/DEAH box helicase [Ruminococcus sp.]|nr:DEAD/DEAH box helicase [Ruminococcus sp.]HRU96033.1 DEAD/DEAH box helicase [Ruminococcus sp.]